jgi:hypothetical protein
MSDATTKWKNIRSVRRLVLWLCIGTIVFREIVRAAFRSIAMPEDHLFAYISVFAWLTLLLVVLPLGIWERRTRKRLAAPT